MNPAAMAKESLPGRTSGEWREDRLTPSHGRARPYRGENSGPGKDDRGELDIETRN